MAKAVIYPILAECPFTEVAQADPGVPYNDNTEIPHAGFKKALMVGAFLAVIPSLFFTDTAGAADFPEQNVAEHMKAQVSAPAINFDKQRNQYLYPSWQNQDESHLGDAKFVSDAEKQASTSVHPDFVFDKKRIQYSYPSMMPIDTAQMTQAEDNGVPLLNKWKPEYPDFIFDIKEQQYTYPAQETIVKHTASTTTNQCTTYHKPTGTNSSVDAGAATVFDNAWADDGVYASFNAVNDQATYQTFGDFGIPANAIIKGIQCRVEGKLVGAGVNHNISFAMRMSGILFTGSNSDFSPTTGSDEVADLGGATNLWGASAAQATVASFADGTFRSRLTMDALSATSVDIDYFEASVCYDLTTNTWDEIPPTMDKWESPTMKLPNPHWGNKLSIPALYSIISFYPEPQPNPPEDITLDKWIRLTPDYIFDIKEAQHTYPDFFTDPFHLLDAETISDVSKWRAQAPDLIFDKVRMQYTYPSYTPPDVATFAEDVTGKWGYFAPDLLFDIKRQQHTYPSLFIDPYQLTQAEQVSPDRFVSHQPDQVFDKKRLQFAYPYLWFDPEPIPVTTPEFIAPIHQTNVPLFDKKRGQWLYPVEVRDDSHFADVQPVRVDMWIAQWPDIIFSKARNQYLYPSYVNNIDPNILPAEDVTSDKWTPRLDVLVFDKKRQQFVYESFFIDPKHLLDAETITSDKWTGWYPDLIFDKKRAQYTYPTFWIDAKALSSVFADDMAAAWGQKRPDLVFDKKRQQITYPYLFYYDGLVITYCPPFTGWTPAVPSQGDWEKETEVTTGWTKPAAIATGWSKPDAPTTDWEYILIPTTDWEDSC